MKDEQIKTIIDSISDGSYADRAFIHLLSGNIYCGRVWPTRVQGERLVETNGYNTYLIKCDYDGPFVGAILDGGGACVPADFRVYMKKEYRERHLMASALKDVFLPHVFSQRADFEKLRATFESEIAKHLLEKVGFTITRDFSHGREGHAYINRNDVPHMNYPEHTPSGLTCERIEAIENSLNEAITLIRIARDELTEGLGGLLPSNLTRISKCLESTRDDLKPEWRVARLNHVRPKPDVATDY